MLIINAHVLTCCTGSFENGYVEITDGIITATGDMKNAPTSNEIYNAEGGFVCPGFIDGHTHMGMTDFSKPDNIVNEDFFAADAFDFDNIYFRRAAAAGVTTVAIAPPSFCPVGGTIAVVKTAAREILRRSCAVKMAMGENPRKAFGASDSEIANIINNYQTDLPAHIHAHTAADIKRIRRKNAIIIHGTEALPSDGYGVMAGPMLTDISKHELYGLSYDNIKKLWDGGTPIAIISDHPETPSDSLLLYAQLAAKYGVSFDDALIMITANPAKMLGIADRVGGIAPGCDGDIIVTDRHPIDFYSQIKRIFYRI